MKSFFKNLFRSAKISKKSSAKKRGYQPQVEALEGRRLMNADWGPGVPGNDMINEDDDILYIRGTDANDLITVEYELNDPSEVRVSVYQYGFSGFSMQLTLLDSEDHDIDDFNHMEMRGFGGDDFIVNMTNLNSFMYGHAGSDWLFSGGGNDVMDGGANDDEYYFQHEISSVYYGSNVEYYFASFGSDTIVEANGGGSDLLRLDDLEGAAVLDLANPNSQDVSFGRLNLNLRQTSGALSEIEDVRGTGFGDTIRGNHLDNSIFGLGGADTLEGRAGDDYLNGSSGDDTYVFSNATAFDLGADFISDYTGEDTLDFSSMVDNVGYGLGIQLDLAVTAEQQIHATSALTPFQLRLNLGTSVMEDVVGSPMYDTIFGNSADNSIWGMGGGDYLYGRLGNDTLDGGAGNDTLQGDEGNDVLIGGAGSDRYTFRNDQGQGNLGLDSIAEGANADNDRLYFYGMTAGINVDLQSTATQTVNSALQIQLNSTTGIERVDGTNFDDVIYGNSRANTLSGKGGNDVIYGRDGADTLYGDAGRDYLYGGNHNDTLFGGNDNDVLIGEGGLDILFGGDGADYLNGDYLDHYVSDGQTDLLYGYTQTNSNDGDRDMFAHHRRYIRLPNGSYTSEDAGWESLEGFNSNEDIRHYYYGWNF